MSQPIGIISKIKISEKAYKRFLKQEAKEIANELFYTFWHKLSNIYLFQYNKKEEILYIFVYYNYGNAEFLKESTIYKAIERIEPFLDEKSEGYFFGTLDSINFENYITKKIIEKQKLIDYQFSQEELTDIGKEAYKKFFYKVNDISDYENFFDEHLSYIDKAIIKHFKILKEEARIKVAKEDLPKATPINPIQLFKGYFYNGSHFYYCDGIREIICFENIDLQNLTEVNYGLTDGKYMIIGNKVKKVDDKEFKEEICKKEIYEQSILSNTFYELIPDEYLENSLDYCIQFNTFLENPHFKNIYTQYKYNPLFLEHVNNYLSHCWSLYTTSNDMENDKKRDYLIKGLEFYKKVENHYLAELNPFIFHHLTSICVALNYLDEAIKYFEKAFFYGYLQFHLMLTDENLKPIFNHKRFIELKNWFNENVQEPKVEYDNWRFIPNNTLFPYFNSKIVELLEKLPENCKQGNRHEVGSTDYLHYIMKNFFIWDKIKNPDDNDKTYNKLLDKFTPYFNRYLQKTIDLSWQEKCAYNFYKDYNIVNAKTDLASLEYFFFQAHYEYGIIKMDENHINELISKIKSKYQQASQEDKKYIKSSKILELLKVNI
jgi:hypothetical protein